MYRLMVRKSPVDKKWYWRVFASNGKIVANGEGYNRKDSLIKTVKKLFPAIRVEIGEKP